MKSEFIQVVPRHMKFWKAAPMVPERREGWKTTVLDGMMAATIQIKKKKEEVEEEESSQVVEKKNTVHSVDTLGIKKRYPEKTLGQQEVYAG